MTTEEAKSVLTQLKVAFPAWYAWFLTLDTKKETAKGWERSLESQELADCLAVLDSWQTGKTSCPETYERDRLVYILVEQARAIRNARYAKDQAKSQIASFTQERAEAEKRRATYKPLKLNGLGAAGVKLAHAVDEIGKPKSQWTEEDLARYRQRVAEIVADFERDLNAEPETYDNYDGAY